MLYEGCGGAHLGSIEDWTSGSAGQHRIGDAIMCFAGTRQVRSRVSNEMESRRQHLGHRQPSQHHRDSCCTLPHDVSGAAEENVREGIVFAHLQVDYMLTPTTETWWSVSRCKGNLCRH